MNKYQEVKIKNIMQTEEGATLLLVDIEELKFLLISIGAFEAYSISLTLANKKFERPLTHDLFKTVLTAYDSSVEQVLITSLINNTYYAMIKIKKNDVATGKIHILNIDCRPSDGIAMALKYNAPVFVSKDLLQDISDKFPI